MRDRPQLPPYGPAVLYRRLKVLLWLALGAVMLGTWWFLLMPFLIDPEWALLLGLTWVGLFGANGFVALGHWKGEDEPQPLPPGPHESA